MGKANSMTTSEQQKRVNSACQRVGNVPNSASYYSKSWHVISMMTLNGDASKLGALLRGETSPTPISPPTPAPFTNPPISPPSPPTPPTNSNNCCSFDNKSCSGSAYCNKNQNQCEISCKGFWINAPINVTPVPTVSPTNAPTTKGCYSNNYKNCLPGGSEYASCNNIWLPNGPQDNCVALWEDCTGNGSSCCGPAECFSDGNSASLFHLRMLHPLLPLHLLRLAEQRVSLAKVKKIAVKRSARRESAKNKILCWLEWYF